MSKIKKWAKGIWLALLGKQIISPLHGTEGEISKGTIEPVS